MCLTMVGTNAAVVPGVEVGQVPVITCVAATMPKNGMTSKSWAPPNLNGYGLQAMSYGCNFCSVVSNDRCTPLPTQGRSSSPVTTTQRTALQLHT